MSFEERWKKRCMIRCSCCHTKYTMQEMMDCYSVWVGDNEKYGKTGVCDNCGKRFHEGKWQLISNKDIYRIYTTDLEMPQSPPNFTEDIMNSEYFYETMIQNIQDGSWLGFQARYKTPEDATEGHWIAYDQLEDMILYPEKYPRGIIDMFCNAIEQANYSKDKLKEETKRLSR
jgi:hypothetical protein